MSVASSRNLHPLETRDPLLNQVYQHDVFGSFDAFRPFLSEGHPRWRQAVETGLRRIAIAGIRDPLTDAPIPPSALRVDHGNLRETLSHEGVISRQRAVLLVLRQLIETGELPDWSDLRLYLSEAVTPFAERLRREVPRLRCSEYLPEPDHHLRGQVAMDDLAPATFHAVICNEVLEHVEELVPALRGMAEVLMLGGRLIATVPFLYGQQEHLVKAIWQGEGQPPQVIGEPDFHGNPVSSEGSLVYRYPGWQLLDDLREAGFRDAAVHAVGSTAYGVLGEELPLVFVVVATR